MRQNLKIILKYKILKTNGTKITLSVIRCVDGYIYVLRADITGCISTGADLKF